MIRKMSIKDYDHVFRLWSETSGLTMRVLDDSRYGIETFLERNPNTNFVCIRDEKIVGVIMAGNDGRRGYIYQLVVEAPYRRKGIASRLANTCIKSLYQEGITKVGLFVFEDNVAGRDFWMTQDFTLRSDLLYFDHLLNEDNQ